MRKIFLFMNVTLDGFFEAPGHDISGFVGDLEAFSPGQGELTDTVLLGHRTYEMMKFWATPAAMQTAPEVAKFMNRNLKVVASHAPFEPGWSKVQVITGDVPAQVRQLKAQPGGTIAIFGSNTLCVSLMPSGLIDEFQLMYNPVVFGQGTSLFKGLPGRAALTLVDTRRFKSGSVLLTYKL